jgi:hypothetical protein
VMCLLLFSDVVNSAASAASTDICVVNFGLISIYF